MSDAAPVNPSSAERCAVCAQDVCGEGYYPNAWERALRKHPCCSAECARRYDPDVHWMPASPPAPVSEDEHDRLLKVCRSRLAQGDRATVIVREMLQAGLPSASLRKVVFFSSVDASKAKRENRERNVLGAVFGRLTGKFLFTENRDPRDQEDHDAALRDLERWENAFEGHRRA